MRCRSYGLIQKRIKIRRIRSFFQASFEGFIKIFLKLMLVRGVWCTGAPITIYQLKGRLSSNADSEFLIGVRKPITFDSNFQHTMKWSCAKFIQRNDYFHGHSPDRYRDGEAFPDTIKLSDEMNRACPASTINNKHSERPVPCPDSSIQVDKSGWGRTSRALRIHHSL